MKKRNAKKSSPEEAFLRSAEGRMDIELDYSQIKDQLDTAEIARVGAQRRVAEADTYTIRPATTQASRGPSATVVLATVLAVITAVGFGGFLIAKQAGQTPPPVEDPHGSLSPTVSVEDSVTHESTLYEPDPGSSPEDSSDGLSPDGTVDPDETHNNPDTDPDSTRSEDTIFEETLPDQSPLASLDPSLLERLPEVQFDPDSSYATENNLHDPNRSLDAEQYTLFLRAAQLPAELAGADQPTMLWVEEYDLWQRYFPSLSAHTNENNSVLDISLSGYNARFFEDHSLLILFTEGRSGSVRYRLDDTAANHVYVKATLTAGVPAANTMDIAYWCVMIPVAKPKSGETNRTVYLETRDTAMESFEEFVTLSPEIYRGLWFYGYHDGSYERDGYLYGRIGNLPEIWQTVDHPDAETFTSYEEWQARYGGCYTYLLNKAFYEGICGIDEAFFTQKSLVVAYVVEPSGSIHHRVDGVTAEDGSLTVKITSLDAGVNDDMGYWAILIPIDKELDSLPITLKLAGQYYTWDEYEALPEWQNWEILEEE